jgi:DNA modification methylase
VSSVPRILFADEEPVSYQDFLRAKMVSTPPAGFEISLDEVHPYLKPHSRLAVQWAVRGGRRGLFLRFGLHKTLIQIETVRLVMKYAGGRGLIGIPLGVRQEFFRDAAKVGVELRFIRSDAEIDESFDGIYLTNYESIREGKVTAAPWTVVSFDEADVLRSFGSKTFGEIAIGPWSQVPYKFVATATPDPNEYLELLGYSHFLGVGDIGQIKTRFFKRDSEHADHLTLHAHKEKEFWLWVASWALIVHKPSDLGFSDEGYELPPMEVHWHEIRSDHAGAGHEKNGQARLLANTAHGITEASREKRRSLPDRLAKMMELRALDPGAHRILWHDLEDERREIEKAIPGVVSVYGKQPLDEREAAVIGFSDGEFPELAAKAVIAGAGCNFQRHCAWSIFLGIGYKFRDLLQAIHRTYRFLQPRQVRVDLIYTEAERAVRHELEAKWQRYNEQTARMSALIREYGLAELSLATALERSIGVERQEASGAGWCMVNADSVEETARMQESSVDLILTSLPFSSQYEYTPSFNDFGHTDDSEHFWRQMDYLTPELLRVLKPGRDLVIHIKDRVAPGALSGTSFQTMNGFHCEAYFHYLKHGFACLGMITVTTDVVRENAGTHRLSWTMQCNDASRMGAGMPEYLWIFRKLPTDNVNGFADEPVRHSKARYTRGRWQVDAHGFWRSSGNRLLLPEELPAMTWKDIYRRYRGLSSSAVYDYEHHVECGEALERAGQLPPDFFLLPPQSVDPWVWSDITRMQTLNGSQARRGKEKHICPLQLDIVARVIEQRSMPGDVVYDPFAGLGTVPYLAVKKGRRGRGCELNTRYFLDAVGYCEAAEREASVRTLFDLLEEEEASAEPPHEVQDLVGAEASA